ncbi:MAG: hypothetical protein LAN70_03165 [Acidobacteriia bacterium]|nr:hypothetical protein [Terriglobia bacterium]
MIGVIADPSDFSVVQEFFELFKTPWEFYREGRHYSVLLCSGDSGLREQDAQLVVIYGGAKARSDAAIAGSRASGKVSSRLLSYKGARLQLYFESFTFDDRSAGILVDAETLRPAVHETRRNGAIVVRVGYDLFREVRHLLTVGQPAPSAPSPTLDLHIAFLRDVIRSAGISLIEIPPVPFGYRFIACLTHDVDHPFVRRHKFDHTMFGFLYRALIGSAIDLFRRRTSAFNLLHNWLAALKLPFVHLGLAKDFWSGFERYQEIEGGSPSSFFIIPFRNNPGRGSDGCAPRFRGATYGASDVADQVHRLLAADCEVGLHGIDAWVDSAKGREELNEIRLITGARNIGVRMHWLFFDEQSPVALESAGASYDSTVGYNETIGYRAGTGQVYKPLNATTLLELPLHVMDTALFYPSHLHLSPEDAQSRINDIIENAVRQGGCVTVNWHDRSIAPERLWTGTYVTLVQELRDKGAWFATASQATAWFRMRRSATFAINSDGSLRTTLPASSDGRLPALTLRKYRGASGEPIDVALKGVADAPCSHAVAVNCCGPTLLG